MIENNKSYNTDNNKGYDNNRTYNKGYNSDNSKTYNRDNTNIYTYFRNGVTKRESEPVAILVKRFKKEVIYSGLLTELKKREYYEKPSFLRKKAKESFARRNKRKKLTIGLDS